MHKVDVPRFKTLNLYDKTLREVCFCYNLDVFYNEKQEKMQHFTFICCFFFFLQMAAILFCCTESEANRVGRFYRDVFEQVEIIV